MPIEESFRFPHYYEDADDDLKLKMNKQIEDNYISSVDWNIIKYAQRYGKKGGYNRDDLKKIIHYAIIMLHLHDNYYSRERKNDEKEKNSERV